MTMHYPNSADHHHPDGVAIELNDHVELRLPGLDAYDFEGRVTALYPRLGMVKVRYQDWLNETRRGDPVTRSVRVPIDRVVLERRDG